MVDLSGVDHKSIFERAKAIILSPKDEWLKIAGESKDQGDILRGYVLPLAAIGPVASLIGGQVFGFGAFGFSYRPSLVGSLVTALISYALGVALVYVMMFIADFLAPKFEGEANRANAFKLAAYSYTASWVAGIFGLIPALAVFSILGLYSIYLIYTGATPMMKVPESKAGSFTAVLILCGIVLALVIAPITAAVTGIFALGSAVSGTSDGGTIKLPGGETMDIGKMEEFGKKMENVAAGKSPPVDPAKIQALLPAAIGAYQRTATESVAMGPMGATAEGTYTSGDSSFTLRVADMSALGAIAGLGAAFGVSQSKEDANGYEKTGSVDGQMQSESWSNASKSGKFGRMVAERFMVEAEGSVASIDQLKAAVATVDTDDLEDLVE